MLRLRGLQGMGHRLIMSGLAATTAIVSIYNDVPLAVISHTKYAKTVTSARIELALFV